ncbi:Rieske (2Fe-2S) protein [Pengzhenrongella sicca]|uniref:Cytochrome bc1 complex Rieske iron-sulfur subunit n=1 Tax=Pengzhenrongella sicca TaxID=2819238 RepID=A0A8A4ZHX0_9MICO|nr:Rieske (2Fe-2S) protein [Pengzhenrongella sicca]
MPPAPGLSRRGLLRGVGAATLGAVAVGTLAACSTDGDAGSTGTSAGSGAADPTDSGSADAGAGAATGALAKVADIPVGGAISATDSAGEPIILSQPTEGTIVGMSAICTHQGCTVLPAGEELDCPCHGSVFKAADGSTVSGPASEPLPAFAVRVENGEVLEA